MRIIELEPLTAQEFAPFGNVIEIGKNAESFGINAGTTQRFHDLATVTTSGKNDRPIISMARAQPFSLPLKLTMLERHPDGSQAFIPVTQSRFVVIVAPDENGSPGTPRAFMASPGQGVNYLQNTWHGVLTALDVVTDFLIVDKEENSADEGENLEIFEIADPYEIRQ